MLLTDMSQEDLETTTNCYYESMRTDYDEPLVISATGIFNKEKGFNMIREIVYAKARLERVDALVSFQIETYSISPRFVWYVAFGHALKNTRRANKFS